VSAKRAPSPFRPRRADRSTRGARRSACRRRWSTVGFRNASGESYVDNPGMQPELYFELEVDWSHGNDVRGGNVFTFTLPYDAIAWTESQRILGGLRGVLP
jgi:hypothetical protein